MENFKENRLKLKSALKQIAHQIKTEGKDYYLSAKARHLHIVYGLYRGMEISRMEKKCRSPLCLYYFDQIEREFNLGLNYEEAIRYSRSVLV